MATQIELTAEFRDDVGKGASRRLRRSGKVPAVIYGGKQDSRAITLDSDKLIRGMETEAFYSSILNIRVGDLVQPAIVKDMQRHPAKRAVLHVDFQRVLEDQEIRVNVPLHFLNEEACIGVKQQGGVLSRLENEVEVSCLPKNLPEYIDVDVAELELEKLMTLEDIVVPEGVELVDLAHGRNLPIVAVHHARAEEVEVVPEEVVLEEEAAAAAAAAAEGEAGAAPAEEEKKESEGEGGE